MGAEPIPQADDVTCPFYRVSATEDRAPICLACDPPVTVSSGYATHYCIPPNSVVRWHLGCSRYIAAGAQGGGRGGLHREEPVAQPAAAGRPQTGGPLDPLTVPERPALAPGVQLCGTVQGSGFADRQWLIQRDGGFFQLTELLYRVAEHLDGRRTLDEVAAGVSAATGRRVSADNVRQLIRTKLIPARLVARASGSAPGSESALRSPLAVNLRLGVSPRLIEPIARVLQVLYLPPVLIAILLVAAAAHGWLYFAHGVAGGVRELRDAPGLLLLLLPLSLASALFHEFGHAAALCYGGGRARGLGIGLYLMLPVFYTDVTDVYRLGRWARIRTDLGGLYFNLIFGLGLLALYLPTRQEVLLLAVVVINLEMLYQFLPFVRYDGYWLLADLTGIPDFFSMIGPFLRSVLPGSWWGGGRLPKLKRWVAAAFAVYILVTVPLLAFLLFLMVRRTPSILIAAWNSVLWQAEAFVAARVTGNITGMAISVVHLLTLALYTFGLLFVLFNLGRRASGALWRWSKPTPARRAIGLLVAAGVVALVGYLWAPQLQVSPEQPDRHTPIDTPGPTPAPEPSEGTSPGKTGERNAQAQVSAQARV